MVSDGVSGDGTWVEGILPRLKGLSPEAMAARLLQRARDLGIPGDDRTVLVTRLQADGVHLHAGRAARSWQSRIDPEGSASNAVQFDHNVLR